MLHSGTVLDLKQAELDSLWMRPKRLTGGARWASREFVCLLWGRQRPGSADLASW